MITNLQFRKAGNHMQIYLLDISQQLDEEMTDQLLELITKEERENKKKFQTACGKLFIHYLLREKFSLAEKDIKLLKTDSGKPYIEGLLVHFNLSHATDYVVCAMSDQEIGIDIEKIRAVNFKKIAKRFFCESEYEDLLAKKQPEQLNYFFQLWTLKESYLKWLGTGLRIPLNSCSFKVTDEKISCKRDGKVLESPYFKQLSFEGYQLSVCSPISEFPDEVMRINFEDVINNCKKFEKVSTKP